MLGPRQEVGGGRAGTVHVEADGDDKSVVHWQPGLGQGIRIALETPGACRPVQLVRQHGDPLMPKAQQQGHKTLGRSHVVDEHRVLCLNGKSSVRLYDRNVLAFQVFADLRRQGSDDDAADPHPHQHLRGFEFLRGRPAIVNEDHGVTSALRALANPGRECGVKGVPQVGNQHSDRRAAATAKVDGNCVRDVPELVGRRQHPLAHVGRRVARAAEGASRGGARDASQLRNVIDGGSSLLSGGSLSHQRAPVSQSVRRRLPPQK